MHDKVTVLESEKTTLKQEKAEVQAKLDKETKQNVKDGEPSRPLRTRPTPLRHSPPPYSTTTVQSTI